MAKMAAKAAVIIVDDSTGSPQTISADCTGYTCDYTSENIDVTGFGEPQNFVPGVMINKVSITAKWNTTATTGAFTVLSGIVGSSTSKTIDITPEGTGLSFAGEFMCAGIHVTGSAQGSAIELGTVDFYPMGAVVATWA